MTPVIQAFLDELDRELVKHAQPGERLDLFHVGRSALILHYGLAASTHDFDVVQMHKRLEPIAIELFGTRSENARRMELYLELVPQGIPPVPQNFRARCTEVPGIWRVVRLWKLEPHDLAATKMKCFRPQDREDIKFLCDEGLVTEEGMRASLESAFLWSREEDEDPPRVRAFTNLERVVEYLQGRRKSI